MAWMITLQNCVDQMSDCVAGIIEDRMAAEECAPLLMEIYNREFPEYSGFYLTEVVP